MRDTYLIMKKRDPDAIDIMHLENSIQTIQDTNNYTFTVELKLERGFYTQTAKSDLLSIVVKGEEGADVAQALCELGEKVHEEIREKYYLCSVTLESSLFYGAQSFPKLAEIELKLREVLLRVLSSIYGPRWIEQFPEEHQETVRRVLRVNSNSPSLFENAVHSVDFSTLTTYLFFGFPDEVPEGTLDFESMPKLFADKTEEEIRAVLRPYECRSVWDRLSEVDGSISFTISQSTLREIGAYRNKVVHFRRITHKDYETFLEWHNAVLTEANQALDILASKALDTSGFEVAYKNAMRCVSQYSALRDGISSKPFLDLADSLPKMDPETLESLHSAAVSFQKQFAGIFDASKTAVAISSALANLYEELPNDDCDVDSSHIGEDTNKVDGNGEESFGSSCSSQVP